MSDTPRLVLLESLQDQSDESVRGILETMSPECINEFSDILLHSPHEQLAGLMQSKGFCDVIRLFAINGLTKAMINDMRKMDQNMGQNG